MKFPLTILAMLLFLSCAKDFNKCPLICGQYDGTTKVTVKDIGPGGQDLVSKNESVLFIEQINSDFIIDNQIFSLDRNGEFEVFDTPEGKVRVYIKWEANRLLIEEDFGGGRTSLFEGVKVE